MYSFAMQPKEVLESGKAAADTLTQTVLGSLVVLFMIFTGIAIWLAWKAKQSELATLKEVMKASADERVEAKEFAMAQTKAYETMAVAVDEGFEGVKASVRSNGKNIDALANAVPDLDTKLYYASKGSE